MLCDLRYIFDNYNGKCIAGFNVYGYEDAAAVISAACTIKCPVILMVNVPASEHMPVPVIGVLLAKMAETAEVPVCVHLDHATSIEKIELACGSGFTSVMFDGSQLPYEKNVQLTRKVCMFAHKAGLSVEAEIGSVGYTDPAIKAKTIFTDPDEASAFYKATGVDALAVSVGTTHRQTTQNARIQFDRLDEIMTATDAAIVIHGASSVTDGELTELARRGVRKINLGTCLRKAFDETLWHAVKEADEQQDRIKLFRPCMEAVRQEALKKLRLINL